MDNKILSESSTPPYDSLQSFIWFNHVAMKGKGEAMLPRSVFAIKEVFKVLGSTYSKIHPYYMGTYEPYEFSFTIQILEASVDMMVGKTNYDELYYGISDENWYYSSPIVLYDPLRLKGESSGDPRAAIAGGSVNLAFDSDYLGFDRVPAI